MRARVELFEQIRQDRQWEGLSIRELADRHRVHRRTVRQALASSVPPPRKAYVPRSKPAIDPWTDVIDGWLVADRTAPRKQRHTARRVWQRLIAEHGAVLSETTVSRYVGRRRLENRARFAPDSIWFMMKSGMNRGSERRRAEISSG